MSYNCRATDTWTRACYRYFAPFDEYYILPNFLIHPALYVRPLSLFLTPFVLSASTTSLSFNAKRCHVSRIALSFASVLLARATTSSCSLPIDFLWWVSNKRMQRYTLTTYLLLCPHFHRVTRLRWFLPSRTSFFSYAFAVHIDATGARASLCIYIYIYIARKRNFVGRREFVI